MKKKLFEIGLKHADRNQVQAILEKALNGKFENIGHVSYMDEYDVLEEPNSKVILSAYQQYDNHVRFANALIISGNYIGIIVPGLKLTNELGKALKEGIGEYITISYPVNNYGGLRAHYFHKDYEHKDSVKISFTRQPAALIYESGVRKLNPIS